MKKARESKPKLYDVPDSDETLELSEKSRSKMLLKEQDPLFVKHRINTKPINYDILNNDYYKRFVRQTDLYIVNVSYLKRLRPILGPISFFTTDIVRIQKTSYSKLFELSELKAQSQAKDTVIVKLKEQIKSLRGNEEDSSTYKQLYDSIKPKRVQSKEQCDALIKQVNIKSGEISDLNAKLQEQGLVIAALKNELRKLKGKAIDNKETVTHSVDPNVSKDNMEPITPKLGKRCESEYIKREKNYVADPDNAYPKRSITKLILKGAVIFDVVSYQFRCALNYSKLVSKL
ncbi:hypothetical protein Tco_1342251 [Tanacetum coccineum]